MLAPCARISLFYNRMRNYIFRKYNNIKNNFSQETSVNDNLGKIIFDEVFAPVIRQTTLHLFLKVASNCNFVVRHMGVEIANFNGTSDKNFFMRQSPGFG